MYSPVLGFSFLLVQNTWGILLLWVVGGILALFGAFAYAELGTHFKESGGDYIYLSRVFHPVFGYLSAWAGLTIGFSAPVALAAMAFTKYLAPFGLNNNVWLAVGVIVFIGLMHSFTIRHSSRFQNGSTLIKVAFIVCLILLGFILPGGHVNAVDLSDSWKHEVLRPGFAVSMVFVAFAYTGWNAAAYVADEIENPGKNFPRALIGGTLFVSLVYILFQYVLLKNATVSQLQGREEVTFISFSNLLGSTGKMGECFYCDSADCHRKFLFVGGPARYLRHGEGKPFMEKLCKKKCPCHSGSRHLAARIYQRTPGTFRFF